MHPSSSRREQGEVRRRIKVIAPPAATFSSPSERNDAGPGAVGHAERSKIRAGMFSAGSGGKGGAAAAGQPASAHHLDYAAGHAQFARQDPGPSGSYAAQSDYEYVQGGPTYAPPGYAEYRDRVPSSSSGSGFDHSRYAVAPHANLSHAPRQPSAGYPSYATPHSNPADAQTMHDQAAWAQGGIAGPSPKLGAFLLSGGDPESRPQR